MKVIFCHQTAWQDKGISLITGSRWTHCGVITRDGRSVIESQAGKGVRLRNLDSWVAAFPDHEIIDVPCESPEAGWTAGVAELGKPYDWTGLVWFVLPMRDWQKNNAWFCSELAAYMLLKGKAVVADDIKEAGHFSPGSLYRLLKASPSAQTLAMA